jgi:hypothetical protein
MQKHGFLVEDQRASSLPFIHIGTELACQLKKIAFTSVLCRRLKSTRQNSCKIVVHLTNKKGYFAWLTLLLYSKKQPNPTS